MNKILALDFDGVICDGLPEYFHSSRLTYEIIWQKSVDNLEESRTTFNYLRPIIETGWEMPLIFRAMTIEKNPTILFNNWHEFVQRIIKNDDISKDKIAHTLDIVRQEQINNNLIKWLNLHQFYPQVINRIDKYIQENIKIYIITTKEGIFAKKLLENQQLETDKITFWGKEQKRPKYESIRLIIDQEKVEATDICFIEDRLEALETVSGQSDLSGVRLFLASWGYNTEKTRASVTPESGIKLLSLTDFTKGDIVNLFS
ncbi:Haloacid dehalogenase domain protein hydrolase [Cyanobacterium stanieri PCC 7202]|uniref:Haloacid dehalogenase domain protein hydrolase n=1 Tax=Cyanobacterium stanieri (strain ATCC 29140 / PCC 7202) TaxID=292563 RepID=K9YLG1_CYASC|nr:Haloacid dehalogenase domain protein hydrolase [Cyanobacterium stanieri PCC 7202]